MAALPDDEKQQANVNKNIKFDVKDPPVWSKKDIEALDAESKTLINHKCEYKLGKNGVNLTFMPSPHLYDKDGKYDFKKDPMHQQDNKNNRYRRSMADSFISVEKACSYAAGKLDCDAVESTFIDQDEDKYKGLQLIGSRANGFISACEIAWAEHYPLIIEPSHIWLAITQGVAFHVDQNAEALREKYVMHKGKKELIVRRDGFVKGNRKNDWAGVIDEFCEQIDKNTVKDTVELLEADFSNATKVDKINAKITIMDICKNYFDYTCMTDCGFPKVTLTGTKQDWIKIYNKTQKLLKTKVDSKFGEKWGNALLPVLQRFVMAFDGKIDCLFWNSMIKRGATYGSGSWSWYSGWFNVFYPIIKGAANKYCVPYESTVSYVKSGFKNAPRNGENDVNFYPRGLSSAPVKWMYYSVEFKLKFIGGFIGVQRSKENELSPMVGYIIGEQTKENIQVMQDVKNVLKNNKEVIKPK